MIYVKQSTAVTLLIGPCLDDTDGKTAETGLTIAQADVRLSKNGGNMAQKNDATSCTHDELGYYTCPLDTTDTNTLGLLKLMVSKTGALPVWTEAQVLTANVYDTLFSTDQLDVNVTNVAGTSQTGNDNGADINAILVDTADMQPRVAAIEVDTGTTLDGKINTIDTNVDSILVDTNELQTNQGNWLTATGFSTHSAADVWAVTTRTLSSFGTLIADIWANVTRTITGTVVTDSASRTASKADVSSLALEASIDELKGSGFVESTDSNEAIRNRGDAAWTTGAGGSSPTVEQIRTEMDDNSSKLADIVADTNELQLDDIPTRLTTIDGNIASIPTTPMRGTDGANTTVPDVAGTAATLHGITDGKVDNIQTDISTILARITANITTKTEMDNALALLATLSDQAAMKLIVDNNNALLKADEKVLNNQLVKTDSSDHTTILQTFNLLKEGVASDVEPDERVGV